VAIGCSLYIKSGRTAIRGTLNLKVRVAVRGTLNPKVTVAIGRALNAEVSFSASL